MPTPHVQVHLESRLTQALQTGMLLRIRTDEAVWPVSIRLFGPRVGSEVASRRL